MKVDPLLTQAPAKGFVKAYVTGGDDSSGLGVVDQVSIGVCGVADKNALEGSVGHLPPLVRWDVDIGWTAKDPEVTQVRCMAIG